MQGIKMKALSKLVYSAVCVGLLNNQFATVRADVVKMERIEVIQESELIFSGQILTKNCRWNELGNLIVTDYEVRVDQVFKGVQGGETILLTFAGGELDGETHQVSDVPSFEVDQLVVLMVESIDRPLFSPLTGVYQGKFYLGNVNGPGAPTVFDGSGHPIADSHGASMGWEQFEQMIWDEVAKARKLPPPDRSVPDYLLPFVLQDLPEIPYESSIAAGAQGIAEPLRQPDADSPLKFEKKRQFEGPGKDKESPEADGSDPGTMWSYARKAKTVPIVYNPWPNSFPEWCRFHDQYALSRWNVYCNIFQVMTATGNWAWENNRFDMCGFPTNQTMIDQFGAGWGANTLAICWRRWDNSGILEADIAVNPAFSWTTTPFAAYSNTNLHYLPQTMTHEVGHSWGLDHQFNVLSTMNYLPHRFRSYDLLFMDDILAVRHAFPAQSVNRTDLGVYLFNANGFQSAIESTVSQTNVVTGSNVTIGNIVIENIGTSNSVAPTLDWYLVPTIGSWSGNYYVGSTTHGSLNSGNWFLTSRTLTIPAGIPNGTYYFAAFVTNANDSVGSNNSSWLSRQIFVQNPTPPVNDNWSGSIFIPSPFPQTRFGTNVGATVQTSEQHVGPAQATVWWHVRAPANGTFTIDTYGSNFDTMLHAYTGFQNGFANLSLVASNDDSAGVLQSRVDFAAQAGQYYEVRVAGWNGASGNITLNVNFATTTSTISSSFVYHAGSSFDGGSLNTALDSSKTVAKETATPQTLGYENLINTSKGIKGLVFEMQNLPADSLSTEDFAFQMSPPGAFDQSTNAPANWTASSLPSSIVVLSGTPKRVVLQWPDNSMMNRWLRITIRANANTGLATDEVYYLGHLLGETTGVSDGTYTVAFADIAPIRAGIGTNVDAGSAIDIDKSGTVAFADISAMRSNIGAQLTNITVP